MSTLILVCIVILVSVFYGTPGANAIEDYCENNKIVNDVSYMRFTKEVSTEEFAVVGKFKELHCCAKGHRSIEWFKDDKPYPWSMTLSQFIIYPESANQTIYVQQVGATDAGNYTCTLRNDSTVVSHTTHLVVYEPSEVPDDPKPTYISQDMEVRVGDSARLFCEAFVGKVVDLPDARNEAVWLRNGSIVKKPNIRQENITREDGAIFGTYLKIDSVKPQDYGLYVCQINKPANSKSLHVYLREKEFVKYLDPNPLPVKKLLLIIAFMALLAITIITFNIKFALPVRVYLKDRFTQQEENDGKTNDILIVYSPSDSEVALGVLLPTLETRYQYKCGSRELPNNISLWYGDLAESANRNRRIVAVISPGSLNHNWDSPTLFLALKQLEHLRSHLTCILLKELPVTGADIKNAQGESLNSLLQTIYAIQWERSKDEKFWLALRLKLPAKRSNQSKTENINMTQGENNSRLTNGSGESLDDLV